MRQVQPLEKDKSPKSYTPPGWPTVRSPADEPSPDTYHRHHTAVSGVSAHHHTAAKSPRAPTPCLKIIFLPEIVQTVRHVHFITFWNGTNCPWFSFFLGDRIQSVLQPFCSAECYTHIIHIYITQVGWCVSAAHGVAIGNLTLTARTNSVY
jgi:hypothetical protein